MTSITACPGCAAAPLAARVATPDAPPNMIVSLPTIHCAACIGKVERILMAMPGVHSARVNLSLKRAQISAQDVAVETVTETLRANGFEAHALDQTSLGQGRDDVGQALLTRLAVAGFAMMNVMLLSVAVWSGATDATRDMFHLISAAISLPAVIFSAQPFFKSGWSALSVRRLNMDVPISLAILLACGLSLFETLEGGRHAYFDAALSLTFFLLIGRYLDHRTRAAARSAAKSLTALEVHTAQRQTETGFETTRVSDLAVGDVILVPTGMRVPVDGTLTSKEASVDRAFLTGETESVALSTGQPVQAGEVNLGAPFELTATAVGADTTLRRVSALVEMAENSRSTYTALADRAAQIYAPAVHLLALAAFAVWVSMTGDLRYALNIAIAVLIITCPCALGLAVPAVATAAIGRLYDMGFLVKHGTALERLAEIDRVVFDKTGTLTEIGSDLRLDHLSAKETSVLLALAQASAHPMSRAIAEALSASRPATLTEVEEVPGKGVRGVFDGMPVRLGAGTWLGSDQDGVGLRIGSARPQMLRTGERIRAGVPEAIAGMKGMGLPVRMMTGDRTIAADRIAGSLGIDYDSRITAEGKHDMLQQLAADGHKVGMIGDGLNDTAALAQAHASIAPSTALDATRNAADIVVLRDSFEDLPKVLRIARQSVALSKQNFRIATIYNLIAVPIALLGYATPLVAALAMSASSITVLVNALRVRRVR